MMQLVKEAVSQKYTDKKVQKKKVQGPRLVLLCANTIYPLLRQVGKLFKWKVEENDTQDDFDLMWADHAIP